MKVRIPGEAPRPQESGRVHRVKIPEGDFTMRDFKFLVTDADSVEKMELFIGGVVCISETRKSEFTAEKVPEGFLVSSAAMSCWIPVAAIYFHVIKFEITLSGDSECCRLLGGEYTSEDVTSDKDIKLLSKPVTFGPRGELVASGGFAGRW